MDSCRRTSGPLSWICSAVGTRNGIFSERTQVWEIGRWLTTIPRDHCAGRVTTSCAPHPSSRAYHSWHPSRRLWHWPRHRLCRVSHQNYHPCMSRMHVGKARKKPMKHVTSQWNCANRTDSHVEPPRIHQCSDLVTHWYQNLARCYRLPRNPSLAVVIHGQISTPAFVYSLSRINLIYWGEKESDMQGGEFLGWTVSWRLHVRSTHPHRSSIDQGATTGDRKGGRKKETLRAGFEPTRENPSDHLSFSFKSDALTTRPSQHIDQLCFIGHKDYLNHGEVLYHDGQETWYNQWSFCIHWSRLSHEGLRWESVLLLPVSVLQIRESFHNS